MLLSVVTLQLCTVSVVVGVDAELPFAELVESPVADVRQTSFVGVGSVN